MADVELRLLTEPDRAEAAALGRLAFGGDPQAPVRPLPAGIRTWGAYDGGRLVAKASLRDDGQWWGGRQVPMGGVAGVAVHPTARGRGLVRRLLRLVLAQLRVERVPLSALFPTAPGIYRGLGYELVGALEERLLPTAALSRVGSPEGVVLRPAGAPDVPAVRDLWHRHGAVTDGLLTRAGPRAGSAEDVLSPDVVTLAERDGAALGYLGYDRGRGYGPGSELALDEMVASDPGAAAALLRELGSWDAVAPVVRWRGPVDDLELLLPVAVPPAVRSHPWMLRVVDAPGAVAARGYPAAVRVQAAFTLVDPDVPEHEGAWELDVRDGTGRLQRADGAPPRLHVRGLALLLGGAAHPARLRRTGLLDGDVPGLEALVGRPAQILDYF